MTKAKIYIRNLGANWIGYGAKLVVMFFLTPFIVHSLGNTAYGIWCLLVSLTGYMGLLDIGVMTSVSRHINFYLARNDQDNVNRVVSTSLFIYVGISILIFTVATIIGPFLGKIFMRIPHSFLAQAQWILYLFCANIFLGFISAVLRQLLTANNRFDLQNMAAIAVLIVSTTGTIWALKVGYGLVALAIVQVISSLLGCTILFFLARWHGPSFQIHPRFITKKALLELYQFGIFAFVADVGTQFIFYTDSLVIGLSIGAAAITFYNIGLMLVEHGRNIIKQARNVLIPDILRCGGRSNFSETQWLMIKTTRFLMFFAVPLLVGFITLGREFISLWMGSGYEQSNSILIILALSQFGAIASFACSTTLMSLGRVKFLAAIALIEGALNLFFSILFVAVFDLGINGVALGTLIPMIGLTSLAVPLYTCRVIQMKVSKFVRATFSRWFPAALLFAAPCFLASNLPLLPSWILFLTKVSVLGVIYLPIGFYLLLTKEEQNTLLGYLKKCAEFRSVIER